MSVEGGHEPADVRARPLLLAAAALAVALVLVGAGQALLLHYYEGREARRLGPEAPVAGSTERFPPEPRLLSDPRRALDELRAEEDALLHGYAWVNREAGVVRIPIEHAIDLLAGHATKASGR